MLTIPQEIKELLHQDSCKKNIRIHFPNGERTDICNDLIVMDSVKFTESLCSQNELKFGLCESPVFECEVVGVGNIKGATIEVYCEIFCPASVEGAVFRPDLQEYVYPLPYGTFTISDAKRQADMNHRRIVAYSNTYNSINYDISNSVAASMASRRTDNANSLQVSTYWEDMIYETYPDWFDKDGYEYDEYSIVNLINTRPTEGFTPYHDTLILKDGDLTYSIRLNSFPSVLNQAGSSPRYLVVDCDEVKESVSFEAEYKEAIEWLCQQYPNAQAYKNSVQPKNLVDMSAFLNEEITASRSKLFVYFQCSATGDSTPGKRKYFYRGKVVVVDNEDSADGTRLYPKAFQLANAQIRISLYRGTVQSSQYLIKQWEITRVSDDSKMHTVSVDQMTRHALTLHRTSVGNGYYNFEEEYFSIDWGKAMIALAEIKGVYISVSRKRVKEINIKRQFGLNPAEELYPGGSLYPQSVTGGKLLPEDYQSCWYEDEYTKPFGAIYCEYKNTSNVDSVYTLYLTGYSDDSDPESYKTYNLTDNYYIKYYTWTEAQIETLCQQLAANIEGVSYMPVDFVGRGLPYVEAGDTFEILTASNDSITTIVLNRTISGEQVLTDSYKSV